MSAEHLANLPNLAAMLILIASLLYLQRRQPCVDIHSWLLALSLIFASQISWYFIRDAGFWHFSMHTVRLDADLLAGMAFILYTGRPLRGSPLRVKYFAWNAAALMGLETLYGFDMARPGPYMLCAALGIVVAVASGAAYRLSRLVTVALVVMWLGIGWEASLGHYRTAAYWALASIYGHAAVNLWKRLPRWSAGQAAMATSLAIWSASFLTHSWVMAHPYYRSFADQIWSLQKFFITIGMLIVLLEEEITQNQWLAVHDQLTGLPNRRLLESKLLSAITDGSAGVLMMDLDRFKEVNDSMGHMAGDQLLKHVGKLLGRLVEEDETVVRVGGDEFLIVSPRPLDQLAIAIRAILCEPIPVNEKQVYVGASVGLAMFPADAGGTVGVEAMQRLIHMADQRMYELKTKSAASDGSGGLIRPRFSGSA